VLEGSAGLQAILEIQVLQDQAVQQAILEVLALQGQLDSLEFRDLKVELEVRVKSRRFILLVA
jgi:hypothetical protein